MTTPSSPQAAATPAASAAAPLPLAPVADDDATVESDADAASSSLGSALSLTLLTPAAKARLASGVSGALGWLQATASSLSHVVGDALAEVSAMAPATPAANDDDEEDSIERDGACGYTLTPTLLEFASALAEHEGTWLHFPRSHQAFVMTRAQEEHARLLLARCRPIAELRFRLVPQQIPEAEFWRTYFVLMRQVARKIAARAEADEDDTPSTADSDANSIESSPSAAAAAPLPSTPASPAAFRSALDFSEIDRLCGVGSHGRRVSLDLESDDEDTALDVHTQQLVDALARRQRQLSSTFSPALVKELPNHARESSDLNTSELGVSEAELDAALAESSLAADPPHVRASSVALQPIEELP